MKMPRVLRLVAGILVSAFIAGITFEVSFMLLLKVGGGPHNPLLSLSLMFALISFVLTAAVWQRWSRKRNPVAR